MRVAAITVLAIVAGYLLAMADFAFGQPVPPAFGAWPTPPAPTLLPDQVPSKVNRLCVLSDVTQTKGRVIAVLPGPVHELYVIATPSNWSIVAVEVQTGRSCLLTSGKAPQIWVLIARGEPM